ncbi:MAG: heavy metal sensor histidine kinase [Gammaproteobacteria bacterium]
MKNANSKLVKTHSIITRLTLFYSFAAFILITVIALLLYGTTVHILHRGNYQFLSNEVDILRKLLINKKVNPQVLEQKVIEVPYTETGSVYHYYIRILNDKNAVVIETPQMEKAFHNVPFFNKTTIPESKETDWWDSENGRNYLLIQAPAVYGANNHTWRIQIALDITYQQELISKYLILLIISLIIGTFVAIFTGYWIARNGMRSLYELTDAAKKITVSSLHQRIDPESWPNELRTLGMAFNQMLDRIETSFSHLIQFSADLAHELRTPVNNLMGQTEILLSRDASTEEYEQVLGSNLEELHRISQIIDNLLFLARTENLHLDIKKTTLNVVEEIKLICDFYQAMADEKNIKITCQGFAELRANSVMFRRMISNIISNALKYTPYGGTVGINVKETPYGDVRIDISDTGIGIAAEHLPKIFNRFYRTDAARSQHSGGTGLGLAIVKSIIDIHEGAISITSEPGKGTIFHIILPK